MEMSSLRRRPFQSHRIQQPYLPALTFVDLVHRPVGMFAVRQRSLLFPPILMECDGDIVDQNRNLSANCTCREVWVVLIMLPAAEL
jgi:hypothetical protein